MRKAIVDAKACLNVEGGTPYVLRYARYKTLAPWRDRFALLDVDGCIRKAI